MDWLAITLVVLGLTLIGLLFRALRQESRRADEAERKLHQTRQSEILADALFLERLRQTARQEYPVTDEKIDEMMR